MSSAIESVQGTGDPWLTAIGTWTRDILGSEWSVCSDEWPASYTKPAMMWQVTGVDVRVLGLSSYEMEKRLMGTVDADDPTQECAAVLHLIEAFGAAAKIPLDVVDRRFLNISEPKATLNRNNNPSGTKEGQLTVTLSRRTSHPVKEASLMQFVNYKSNMR